MERPIVYPAEGPADSDMLRGWKAAMVADAWLAQAVIGSATLCSGLGCSPGSGLTISIAAGAIYSQQATDATSYGSLSADSHQIVKQGLSLDPVVLSCPAPATSGQSIAYLVQASFSETDTGSAVLQYFNSADPSGPSYSGPSNSGATQYTIRRGVCALTIKAGSPAATGAQTAPSPDTGNVGLYVVTIANGASNVASGNVAVASGAPFISETLTQKISQATADARYAPLGEVARAEGAESTLAANLAAEVTRAEAAESAEATARASAISGEASSRSTADTLITTAAQTNGYIYAPDSSGAANTVILTLTPALAAYVAGMTIKTQIANSNTGPATINVNGKGAKAIQWNGRALIGGELLAGKFVTLIYDGTQFQIEGLASISGSNSYGSYRIFADGGVEQDGFVSGTFTESSQTIMLPITMGTFVNLTGNMANETPSSTVDNFLQLQTPPGSSGYTTISVYVDSGTGGSAAQGFSWSVKGRL